MWYHRYIFYFFIAILVSGGAFALIMTRFDPCAVSGSRDVCESIQPRALSFFFISTFFLLTAIFSLLGFLVRVWFHKSEVFLDHLNISLRQGLLLSLASLGSLVLLLLNVLTWWSGFLVVALAVLVELYFTVRA
ncbi:MAG: hypothetical protein UY05_C0038G0005 [Candidatus Peregrinibacteria bacterium GW2011_GWA2_47_7]|nr:MAG: hypothetical protein UY05_C0038G0005 [Candidatus Peregrinibacteria bacterium GW2011_GWA2_47_7]